MSDKKGISRRKVIATTSALGSALAGTPAMAAGQSAGGRRDRRHGSRQAASEEAVGEMLESTKVGPQGYEGAAMAQAIADENLDVYIGEYKNAEVPGEKPYAVETLEEYLQREAPPGFEPVFDQSTPGSVDGSALATFDTLYAKEEVGSTTMAGHEITLALGAGLKLQNNWKLGVSVSVSLDVFLQIDDWSVTFSPYSFAMGYERRGKALCIDLKEFKASYLRDVSLEMCPSFSFSPNGDAIDITWGVPTIRLCADPCPGIQCSLCSSFTLATRTDTLHAPEELSELA